MKPGTDTNALRNTVRQAGLQMEEEQEPAGRPRARHRHARAGRRWTVKPGS